MREEDRRLLRVLRLVRDYVSPDRTCHATAREVLYEVEKEIEKEERRAGLRR